MNFGDSIRWDSVDQVQSWSTWRAERLVADDFTFGKVIGHVTSAGFGMPNEIKKRRSSGFSIVASNDASEFFFGADNTFCFRYEGVVEDGVVSAHNPVRSFRMIMADPCC